MSKKISKPLLFAAVVLSPLLSTPILISCNNIDFKNDVNVDFIKNKNAVAATDVLSNIKLSSKSSKVTYEVELISTNDKTGEVVIKITPILKNQLQTAFELKIDGFQRKLSEVLKDVKSLDLIDKSKHKVDDYISQFTSTLKDKVTIKTPEETSLNDFLTKYKLEVEGLTLTSKDSSKGIAALSITFKIDGQTETKQFEISGFKISQNQPNIPEGPGEDPEDNLHNPENPSEPIDPEDPDDDPYNPGNPSEPTDPEDPDESLDEDPEDNPRKPNKPNNPKEPREPKDPGNHKPPITSEDPEKPEKPNKPENPGTPPLNSDPKDALDAAKQSKLITVDKNDPDYQNDVDAIKEFFKNNKGNQGSRRLDLQADSSWTLRAKTKDSPVKLGKSIKFNNKWGSFAEIIRAGSNKSWKFAQLKAINKGSEISKIIIEFKIADQQQKFEVEFWASK
ncbi:hypothetical protein PR249_03150 [Metamycoplasma hyosynoviae]|uniref:hypothetical protein n=1 Tax=Metamycoplasma hyosynoviae TaxID=29559 RepID=UPI00235A2D6C|nr:hypothetical protein [Metamycoplasma hyosynoviae]MDC8901258.1 hypothetical protein [Metamycoplasma hyosynoviae]MDC8912700.1 hypothetical protein [Metamycoplasma hyosynoviae]MDC8915313.1 hypothetical protein [Metamycoplasma hyosynoviae]MDC8921366.1 hypothetical protein [Metamycoplasma hyosynoviae]MDD7894946.1 hypothetical protein [Metamycoplasma hyosynoviae]